MREHAETKTEVWDGLRGVAILVVLSYHTWLFSWFTPALAFFGVELPLATPVRTGYLGVEIFFVISGFVLFLPYARERVGPTIGSFARRRFLKIVPSYAIALILSAYSALSLVPKPVAPLAALANHVLFIQNSFNDQFGTANSVFWSLAIEVQFYLVFPAIAWAFVRRPTVTAVALIAIATAYRHVAEQCCLEVEVITRQLPAFLDLFACGMLAALLTVRIQAANSYGTRSAALWTLGACAFLAGGWLLIVRADTQTYVPGGKEHFVAAFRTLFGVAVAGFGVCSSFAVAWWRRAIANPVFVFLALISYNLYLWHTLVLIWMWKHDVPRALTPDPHDDPHWRVVYIASGWFACIAISTAVTYFIERPILFGLRRRPFSFDWRAVRLPRIAPSEKRT